MIDKIDIPVDEDVISHIMVNKFKILISGKMRYISRISRKKIVDAHDFMPFLKKPIA
jgi:hypothetical protein